MLSLENKSLVLSEINSINKKLRFFSLVRLILALSIVVLFICFISLEDFLLYSILCIINILIFILVLIFTNPTYQKHRTLKDLEYIYNKHENRRKGAYKTFSPDGKEYVNYEDYKQLDLDLLGPKSLFQYLCCAKSKLGRESLAKQLTNPDKKDEKFTNCVNNLASDLNTLKIESAINQISNDSKECDYNELYSIINKKILISKIGYLFMVLSYLVFIGSLIILLMNKLPLYYLTVFVLINFIAARYFSSNEVFNANSTKYYNLLDSYYNLAQSIISVDIDDEYYKNIQVQLKEELPNLKKTCEIFEMLSYRKNIIFSIFGNGLVYMDYIIACIYNKNTLKSNSAIKLNTFSIELDFKVFLL